MRMTRVEHRGLLALRHGSDNYEVQVPDTATVIGWIEREGSRWRPWPILPDDFGGPNTFRRHDTTSRTIREAMTTLKELADRSETASP